MYEKWKILPKISPLIMSANSGILTQSSDNNKNSDNKVAAKNSSAPKTKYEKKLARFQAFASVERCFDSHGNLKGRQENVEKKEIIRFNDEENLFGSNDGKNKDDQEEDEELTCINFMSPKNFLESMSRTFPESYNKNNDTTSNSDSFKNHLQTFNRNLNNEHPNHDQFLNHFNQFGVINFTDYLFLLSILSKSNHKLNLGFELLDYNGDQTIDIDEFKELEKMIVGNSDYVRQNLQEDNLLRSVFFGLSLDDNLDFPKFMKISNLVREEIMREEFRVLKILENDVENEFDRRNSELQPLCDVSDDEHSLLISEKEEEKSTIKENSTKVKNRSEMIGSNHLLPETFAHSILRQTNLPKDERDNRQMHIRKLFQNSDITIGYEEYRDFNQFLFALEDIAKVLKFVEKGQLYDRENAKNSEEETEEEEPEPDQNQALGLPPDKFQLAVKVATGIILSDSSIDILYSLLDIDGDGSISYNEIIGIFKNRLDRTLKSYLDEEIMSFKRCLFYVGYQRRIAGL